MDVHLERQLGGRLAGATPLLKLAEVIDANQALEARLLVQKGVDIADRHPELVV